MRLPKQARNVSRERLRSERTEGNGIVPQTCRCAADGRIIADGATACCGGRLQMCMLGVLGETNVRC